MNEATADKLPRNLKVTKSLVEGYGYSALEDEGLDDWTIGWNQNKMRFGVCHYGPKRIYLSEFLFRRLEDKREIIDTVLHEVAHAIAYSRYDVRGHGLKWKAVCLEIGARPERCKDAATNETDADYPWLLVCSNSQCAIILRKGYRKPKTTGVRTIRRYTKVKYTRTCGRCGANAAAKRNPVYQG